MVLLWGKVRYHKIKYTLKSLPGRVFSTDKADDLPEEAPRYICRKGSFTLEAAVILPLLACFFVSILFFFRVMQVQLEVQKVLDDTGRTLSVYLPNAEDSLLDDAGGMLAAEILLRSGLAERETAKEYISGGVAGVSLLGSRFDGDEVRLRAAFRMKLPVGLLGTPSIRIVMRTECRKWTGSVTAGEGEQDGVWVYITENGTVYHTTRSCTHLTLSIRSIDPKEVAGYRNENGGRYSACSLCGDEENETGRLYIARQGNRYHTTLNCGGIKRTILMVRLSEVADRPVCSKCGPLTE